MTRSVRWLVTGAAGMLAREVLAVLARDPAARVTGATRAALDITDRRAVRAAVAAHDIVVNTAAWTDVNRAESHEEEAFAVNGEAMHGLAAACAARAIPLVHVSTDYVFAGDRRFPYAEYDPTGPLNAYGRSKLAGEHAVLRVLPEAGYVVRTGWLYSRHGTNFVRKILTRLATEETVTVVDDQYGQPTWAGALAERLVELGRRALDQDAPAGIYHGTAAGQTTWFAFARSAVALLGLDAERVQPCATADFPTPAARPPYAVLGQDRWALAGLPPLAPWHEMLRAALLPAGPGADSSFPSLVRSARPGAPAAPRTPSDAKGTDMNQETRDPVQPVVACRVCGGTDWQDVVSFGPLPLANSYLDPAEPVDDEPVFPLGVISCRTCRLMTLTHTVDPDVLYRTYFYVTSDSDTIARHMRKVAELCVERFGIPEGSFVVEMGSNTGQQLAAFQNLGMTVLGVDPARDLAALATERGVETLPDFFSAATATRVVKEYGRARLLLGRHVFAHIDDVADIARGARDLLEPAGVFAIEVPYALDMLEHNEFDTIYHEHLSYFAVSTLSTLFERHGMRVVDVERAAVHGGSIIVFVSRDDAPWQPRPVVDELRRLERESGFFEDATYTAFAERVEHIRRTLPPLVRGLVADGKRVAGYGAPAKGNTLLGVCGLGAEDLEFCIDTTELKQGKLQPGSHIPIRSPEYGAEHAPDVYLLLAWNYAEEILRKERAFLENGGLFVLPVPEPRIVSAQDL